MEMAQNFLTRFEMPKARDSHNFDTTPAARAFLASDVAIKKPVFVSGDAANYSSIDPDSDTRPIEQFLNCLHDLDQEYEYVDESKSEYRSQAFTKVRDVKKRFLNNTQSPRYPRNFPDIANPMPDHGIPHFMRSGSNTVLHDIMRQYLAVPLQDICTCGDKDPETKHCGHTVSLASLQALQCGWMDWQGTAMLAEPGAVTHPHWDKYGTSTWIACLEGEIGFGWQAASPMAIRSSYLANESEPTGRWLFKVLRPGDAVYMPSGTVRFVFRRPKGGQTLGFAAQMLRRGDLAAWMEALKVEMEYSIEGVLADENDTPYHLIVPKLFEGLLRLIGHACEEGGYEKFGGLPKIEALLDLVEECDDVANALVEVQRRRQADANSIAAES